MPRLRRSSLRHVNEPTDPTPGLTAACPCQCISIRDVTNAPKARAAEQPRSQATRHLLVRSRRQPAHLEKPPRHSQSRNRAPSVPGGVARQPAAAALPRCGLCRSTPVDPSDQQYGPLAPCRLPWLDAGGSGGPMCCIARERPVALAYGACSAQWGWGTLHGGWLSCVH